MALDSFRTSNFFLVVCFWYGVTFWRYVFGTAATFWRYVFGTVFFDATFSFFDATFLKSGKSGKSGSRVLGKFASITT